MGWSIVNVTLPTSAAIRGKREDYGELVRQLSADGFEPFSTAAIDGGLIVSFRKETEVGALELAPEVPKTATPSLAPVAVENPGYFRS